MHSYDECLGCRIVRKTKFRLKYPILVSMSANAVVFDPYGWIPHLSREPNR
jgi:hypothetical protein